MWLKRHTVSYGGIYSNAELTRMALTDVSKNMEAHFRHCYLDVDAMYSRRVRHEAEVCALLGV